MAKKKIEKKTKLVYRKEQYIAEKLSYNELCYGEIQNKEPDYRKRDSNLFANSYMDGYNYDDWN